MPESFMNSPTITRPSLFAISLAGFLFPWAAVAVDFKEEVRPILNKKCFKCHTGPRAKAGLRMDVNAEFSKRIGGDDAVIIPGDPAKSLLAIKAGLPRSDGDAMPPPAARGSEAMTGAELNLVKQWIALGAKLDEGDSSEPTTPSAETTPEPDTAAPAEMSTALHTWTNSAGASLQAAFVSLSGTSVTLRKEDGSQFDYPLANLNPESQELAKKLGAQ